MNAITIRTDGDECLSIRLSEPSPVWRGEYTVTAVVDVKVDGFSGSVRGELRPEELGVFRKELARLVERLTGRATLDTGDEWLTLEFSGVGVERLSCWCTVRNGRDGNTLIGCLSLSLVQARATLAELTSAVEAFPVMTRSG
jgi:hypothetical protein